MKWNNGRIRKNNLKHYNDSDVNYSDAYKNKRSKKSNRKIFLSVLILFFCMIFIFTFFNGDRFSDGNIVSWVWEDLLGFGSGQGYPINIDGTIVENNNFKIMNNDIAMLSDISFTSFNKSGRMIANRQHSFASPKLKVKGNRAIIYNVGGKGIQIESTSSTVFKDTLPNNIIAADISKNGNYVVVSESNGYLNEMTLYSGKNEEKYKYYFSEYYITDVAISKKGDYAAATGITSENGNMKSVVYIFDFKSETPKFIFDYGDNTLFSVSFLTDGSVAAVGDKGFAVFNCFKDNRKEFSYDGRMLRCFKVAYNDGVVMSLSPTEDGRNCNVISFDTNGNQRLNIDTEFKVKDVSLKDKNVVVLESDKIHKYNLKGDKKGEFIVGDDSKQVEIFSSNIAFVLGVSNVYKLSI